MSCPSQHDASGLAPAGGENTDNRAPVRHHWPRSDHIISGHSLLDRVVKACPAARKNGLKLLVELVMSTQKSHLKINTEIMNNIYEWTNLLAEMRLTSRDLKILSFT